MKHVQRRHFFVRDMIESFELTVPFVPTDENVADFFTKPMKNASKFLAFRKVIMNEPDVPRETALSVLRRHLEPRGGVSERSSHVA